MYLGSRRGRELKSWKWEMREDERPRLRLSKFPVLMPCAKMSSEACVRVRVCFLSLALFSNFLLVCEVEDKRIDCSRISLSCILVIVSKTNHFSLRDE